MTKTASGEAVSQNQRFSHFLSFYIQQTRIRKRGFPGAGLPNFRLPGSPAEPFCSILRIFYGFVVATFTSERL